MSRNNNNFSTGKGVGSTRGVAPAAAAVTFKGTLLLLQNKTKRDPESYYEEFLAQLRHFDALSKVVTTPQRLSSKQANTGSSAITAENAQFASVLMYLCHVSHCYPKECAHIPDVLLAALTTVGTKLNTDRRQTFVQSLVLLRSKNLVSPDKTMPVLFDLLLLRDKALRRLVLAHIVADIRRFNTAGSQACKGGGAAQFNKVVQNFLFGVVQQDDPTQTRCALLVMLDLYRRGIWANERCVEVIAQASFSRHTRIIRTALRFFLLQFPKITSVDDNSDEEQDDKVVTETMTRAMHKYKCKGKTKKRDRVLKQFVKKSRKKLDPETKERLAFEAQDIDPVRLLRDPQTFAERLLSTLQRTSERFEVRLLFLSVIARIVAEHQCVILALYSYLERFLQPSQVQAATILSLTATCVHPLIPPDALESLVRSIANHFVNDRSQPDAITIGLNSIREICKRQPLAMNADLLRDLVEYRTMRGERGIIMAARSLIQLYRGADPNMLPAKLRMGLETTNKPTFGAPRPLRDIPGMEVLFADEQAVGADAAAASGSRASSVGSSSSGSSSSMIDIPMSDDDDGGDAAEWEFEDGGDGEEAEEDDLLDSDSEGDDDAARVGKKKATKKCADSDDDDSDLMSSSDDDDDDEEGDDDDDADSASTVEQNAPSAAAAGNRFVRDKRPRQPTKAGDDDSDVWESSGDDDDGDDAEKHLPSSKSKSKAAAPSSARGGRAPTKALRTEADISGVAASKPPAAASASSATSGATAATADSPWFEDAAPKPAAKTKQRKTSGSVGGASEVSSAAASAAASASSAKVSTIRLLTDEDFEKLRKIQEGKDPHDWRSARGRKKEILELKRRQELLTSTNVTGAVDASAIESFTKKKRSEDKEEKIAEARELRRQRQPFNAKKRNKPKLFATHAEKAKRGKLFQMTKRSRRVGEKMKLSVEDRREKAKKAKTTNTKFRIARGWKA